MKIKFRPFNYQEDLENIYYYMCCGEEQAMLAHKFQISNIEMFRHWLTEKFANRIYNDFFVVVNESGKAIGFTYSYEFHPYDLHCKFAICMYDEYRDKGYGALVAIKVLDYLFESYPLRQIYTSVFDYNSKSLQLNQTAGFLEVGNLPEYRYHKGKYYSLHILMITRQQYYKRKKDLFG